MGKAPLDRCHMDRCPLDRLDVEQLAVDRVQLELGGLTTEVVVARNDSSRFVIGESAKHRIVVAVQPKADRRVAPPVMPQRTRLVKVIHGYAHDRPAGRTQHTSQVIREDSLAGAIDTVDRNSNGAAGAD